MFGILRCEDELLINHILIIAKQYLYSCRQNKSLPSIKVLNLKIKTIHQLETMIAKSNNKLKAHNMKWDKYKNYQMIQNLMFVAALYQYYTQKPRRAKRNCGLCTQIYDVPCRSVSQHTNLSRDSYLEIRPFVLFCSGNPC